MAQSPHDAIFKAVFSELDNATGVLRRMLPPFVEGTVDWASLQVEPGSFVDRRLGHRHSDLLFSVQAGPSRLLLYVLLEHQSTADPWMALRLLRYMVRVWTRGPRTGALPLIVPLVLSHVEGGWHVDPWFSALLDPDAVGMVPEAVPEFRFRVLDLAATSNADLRGSTLTDEAILTLWLLRDIRDAVAFSTNLATWTDVFSRLERHPAGREKITRLLTYVLWAGEDLQLDEIHAILEDAAPIAGEILMTTIAERLIAEGKARGLAEGLAEGKVESLLTVLEARGLRPSVEQRARIEACSDVELLDQWTLEAVTALSVDDVLG